MDDIYDNDDWIWPKGPLGCKLFGKDGMSVNAYTGPQKPDAGRIVALNVLVYCLRAGVVEIQALQSPHTP